MKFTCIVEINVPRRKVVQLFLDDNKRAQWQDKFLKVEQIKGRAVEVGAKRKIYYQQGKGRMEIVETIQENKLPDEISGIYEHIHMVNSMKNVFKDLGERTRWEAHIEYTKFNGLMPKLLGFLLPGMFKKQTQKWLDQFKELAENEN